MADWLEEKWRLDILPDEATLDIVSFLRAVPTDAQKMEAIDDAAKLMAYSVMAQLDESFGCVKHKGGSYFCCQWRQEAEPCRECRADYGHIVGSFKRKAMRLLGLPTE